MEAPERERNECLLVLTIQREKRAEIKNILWEELADHLQDFRPEKMIVVVLRDLNAKDKKGSTSKFR